MLLAYHDRNKLKQANNKTVKQSNKRHKRTQFPLTNSGEKINTNIHKKINTNIYKKLTTLPE